MDWGIWFGCIFSDSFGPYCQQFSCRNTYFLFRTKNSSHFIVVTYPIFLLFFLFKPGHASYAYTWTFLVIQGNVWCIHYGFFFCICKAYFWLFGLLAPSLWQTWLLLMVLPLEFVQKALIWVLYAFVISRTVCGQVASLVCIVSPLWRSMCVCVCVCVCVLLLSLFLVLSSSILDCAVYELLFQSSVNCSTPC